MDFAEPPTTGVAFVAVLGAVWQAVAARRIAYRAEQLNARMVT